jgi:phosphoribosylformylglycinamidine synthase I
VIGVLQFPGSCDERDAVAACERVTDARLVWHEETDLTGLDGIVVPFAEAGGPVLGICNGFQVLCEAGLLPGALLPNEGLRFVCRQVEVIAEGSDSLFGQGLEPGTRISVPVKHMTGRYFAPEEDLDAIEAAGQVALRYAPGQNPNGSLREIAGVANEGGNVLGLMPHPEHAVEPLTGSDDGLVLFKAIAAQPAPA